MNNLKALVQNASRQISTFAGIAVERVVGITRRDDGWVLECEVVERQGIPNTMDMLGLYEVHIDVQGNVEQFRRRSSRLRGTTVDSS